MKVFRTPLKESLTVFEGSLIQKELTQYGTEMYLLDPTVLGGPLDVVSASTINSARYVVNGDLSSTAANFLNSAWVTAGWTIATLETQLKVFLETNFPQITLSQSDMNVLLVTKNISGSDYTLAFAYRGNFGVDLSTPNYIAWDNYSTTYSNAPAIQSLGGLTTVRTGWDYNTAYSAASAILSSADFTLTFNIDVTPLGNHSASMGVCNYIPDVNSANWNLITHGFLVSNTTVYIMLGSIVTGISLTGPSDELKMQRVGSDLFFYINGSLVYTLASYSETVNYPTFNFYSTGVVLLSSSKE